MSTIPPSPAGCAATPPADHQVPVPRFRSTQTLERQAASVVARLVENGALRRNPTRPPAVCTVANYRDCLLQIARRIAADRRELRHLDGDAAVEYLRTRVDDLGQKALDMHRQALQAMLVHVSGRLPEGQRLTVVRSHKPRRKGGRAYTPQQIRMVAAAQNARNGLSTLIAHAAGLRARALNQRLRSQLGAVPLHCRLGQSRPRHSRATLAF